MYVPRCSKQYENYLSHGLRGHRADRSHQVALYIHTYIHTYIHLLNAMLCWHRPREVAALQDCFVDADGSCFVYEISVRHCEARGFCMYVCVYVLCMYVCMYVFMYICTLYVKTYICMHHVCMYVCLRQYNITRRYVLWRDRTELIVKEIPESTLSHCLPICMNVCMHVCMYVCMYVCMC